MNREQKKKLSREKRRLQNEKRARLEKEIEDMDEVEDEVEVDIPEEPIEKEYYGNYSATSFSELDEALDVQEKVEKVDETSRMVRDLVNNILWKPDMTPTQKAASIKAVADEFGKRAGSIIETPVKKETVADIDALVLEVTQARDKRIINSSAGIKGIVTKTIQSAAELLGVDAPLDKEANAVQIEKDANGDWRAVMWVSNKFIDRDKDIICEAAHKEYVEWVNANKEFMPASLSWHTPETVKESNVDYLDYIDGFLVASVKLTEKEATTLLELGKKVHLGMSHGSFVMERDPNDRRIITKYRMFEVSDLPLKNAANPFTDFETISKEVGMDKLEYLTKILGADKAKTFIEKIGLAKQALEDAQIESKEVTEETPAVETTVVEDTQSDLIAKVLKELDIESLNEFVSNAQEAMEKISVLEDLVKELTGNQEEKLAELIEPPITKKMAWSRPSESKKNIINKGDENDAKLVNKRPELWLSDLTGTVPITIEETL